MGSRKTPPGWASTVLAETIRQAAILVQPVMLTGEQITHQLGVWYQRGFDRLAGAGRIWPVSRSASLSQYFRAMLLKRTRPSHRMIIDSHAS